MGKIGHRKKTVELFWSKITVCGLDECWEWNGRLQQGYGMTGWDGGNYRTHRIALVTLGLLDSPAAPKDRRAHGFVLHECDNRRCCNPTHLRVGTCLENNRDCIDKKRAVFVNGERHGSAKLNTELIREIRSLRGKFPQSDLARKYGVSQSRISAIQREVSWRSV